MFFVLFCFLDISLLVLYLIPLLAEDLSFALVLNDAWQLTCFSVKALWLRTTLDDLKIVDRFVAQLLCLEFGLRLVH